MALSKQEVFPDFELDLVTVRVPYPGASPAEVEQGIVLVVEENVRGIAGVKEIRSVAAEGIGTINLELEEGSDRQRIFQDVQQQVDRIRTFPVDAEEPVVTLPIQRRSVLGVQVYGAVDELTLRECTDMVRDRLLQHDGITQVELEGARDFEVEVEVAQETLRRYGLTLQTIAEQLRQASIEVPSGALDTDAGEILVRVSERRFWAREFAAIPVITDSAGTTVTLGELASVRDGFEDSDRRATFNGLPAIGLDVLRVGTQTPVSVSNATWETMNELSPTLPAGVDWSINRDQSEIFSNAGIS